MSKNMRRERIGKKLCVLGVAALMAAGMFMTSGTSVYATNTEDSNTEDSKKEDTKKEDSKKDEPSLRDARRDAMLQLFYHYTYLKDNNNPDEATIAKMDKLYDDTEKYLKTYDDMDGATISGIYSYASTAQGQLDKIVSDFVTERDKLEAEEKEEAEKIPESTSQFILIGDNWQTPTATYGQSVNVVLPIINLSGETLNKITVTPVTSTAVEEWPFELDATGFSQIVDDLPGNTTQEAAMANRRELTWTFKTRKDVLNGYYKLEFKANYERENAIEEVTFITYANVVGAPGSGSVSGEGGEAGKVSTPRIVVTGFTTVPEDVYAGDTFMLNLHVQNTSQRTAVNNVEINLEAAKEGKEEETTYSAFLPTSGSNTIYIEKIAVGETADLSIEMTAKADLAQKPYALDVNMNYEDDKYNPYTAKSSVSIPIKQEARYDFSTPEVMPNTITVGSESNIMFSVYNTGKTILYNVQVTFEGESITGGDAFIGKLDVGGTGNVDAMVTGAVPTMDDGTVKAIISFEDDAGNVSTAEKEFQIFVMEETYSDAENFPIEEIPVEEGPKKSLIAIIVIVVLIVGAGAAFVIIKKRKKKKAAQKELDEDMDDIEQPTKEDNELLEENILSEEEIEELLSDGVEEHKDSEES